MISNQQLAVFFERLKFKYPRQFGVLIFIITLVVFIVQGVEFSGYDLPEWVDKVMIFILVVFQPFSTSTKGNLPKDHPSRPAQLSEPAKPK